MPLLPSRSPLLFVLAVYATACHTPLPTTRTEGTTTTYANRAIDVQVLPPRAARAQKVVLDDPAVIAIQERDTPFRRFFAEHSTDFEDVDYAKVTILSDVLHRLRNGSYVHRLLEDVVRKHADAIELADKGPAQKDELERRIQTLASALARVCSDLGYPYVDDRDIDRILLQVTGIEGKVFAAARQSGAWPYAEARDVWNACVKKDGNGRLDLVRDLHGALHGRAFFARIIEDSCRLRVDLFKDTGSKPPSLSKAATELRGWATRRLDAATRTALLEGKASLWAAFVAAENAERAGREPKRTLRVDEQSLPTFAAELRTKALAAAVDGRSLSAALRHVALEDGDVRVRLHAASDPSPLQPLFDAVAADSASKGRWREVASFAEDRLAPLHARRVEIRKVLPPPLGSSNDDSAEEVVSKLAPRRAVLDDAIQAAQIGAWRADHGAAGDYEKFAKAVNTAGFASEANALRVAIANELRSAERLMAAPQWPQFAAGIEPLKWWLVWHGARPLIDENVEPWRSLRADGEATKSAVQAALSVHADPAMGLLANAALGRSELRWAALGAMLRALTEAGVKTSLDRLALLDDAQARLEAVTAKISGLTAEAQQLSGKLIEAGFAAMERINADLRSGDRQNLTALRQSADAALAAQVSTVLAAGRLPDDLDTSVEFLAALLRGPRQNVHASVEQLVARFETTFANQRDLFASDRPILDAIVAHTDLGAGVAELREQLRARLPAAVREHAGRPEVEATLKADADKDGSKLADAFVAVLNQPAVSFLLARPGSVARMQAFQSEFHEAFRHRLQEAVAAEGEIDYDYWWLTFYPKAIPLNDASFAGQSLLEIEFPERVVPQEHYMRWLQDARGELPHDSGGRESQRRSAGAKLDAVTTVLASLQRSLDTPGLAGKHDGMRLTALDALGLVRAQRDDDSLAWSSDSDPSDEVYKQILVQIARRIESLPIKFDTGVSIPNYALPNGAVKSGEQADETVFRWMLALRKEGLQLYPGGFQRHPRTEPGTWVPELVWWHSLMQFRRWSEGLGWWYRHVLQNGSREDVADLAELGIYLTSTNEPNANQIRQQTRDGAARALARAPFGYEHLLFAVASAYDGSALLPDLVDLVANAFFDGVDRFHRDPRDQRDSGPPQSPSIRLVDFLFSQKLRVRDLDPGDKTGKDTAAKPSGPKPLQGVKLHYADLTEQRDALDAAVAQVLATESYSWQTLSRLTALFLPTPPRLDAATTDPRHGFNELDPKLHELAVGRVHSSRRWEFTSSRNPWLAWPELWRWEQRLAETEASLRRTIVHMFRGRYPGTPSATEIQRELSGNATHLEALLYLQLRPVWVKDRQRRVLRDQHRESAEELRSHLLIALTDRALMPRGLAMDLVAQIEHQATQNGPSLNHSIYTWVATVMASPTATEHLRVNLVAASYPGLWQTLGVLCEARMNDVPYEDVRREHYRKFVRVAKPSLQPGVQILELLPASRDDLVSMSIHEGGAIFEAAARADVMASYDANQYKLALDVLQQVAKSTGAPTTTPAAEMAIPTAPEPSAEETMLDDLTRSRSESEEFGYSARATGKASFYGRARAAMAYAKRREYLEAAITTAGRGDRLAKWVIRPSDLRSELASSSMAKTLVAASHSGYPNGDQPFHMLVKIPHAAMHQDWAGRDHVYFNSSYVATQHKSLSSSLGQYAWLAQGLTTLLYYPWLDGAEDKPVGVKFPFQWDVADVGQQQELLRTPNLLGGRIELDSTDKIKFSEIKKMLDAEDGFIRATRSAQSTQLGTVLKELANENQDMARQVRENMRQRREAARSAAQPTSGNDDPGQ